MSKQAYEQLTLFQEDSPASLSPLPGSEEAREMTVTSGRKCFASYGRYSHLGSLVKTLLESSIWHSTRCYLTWKTKDTPRKRLLFQLAVSMPRTDETVSAFWPTVLANGMGSTGHQMMLQKLVQKGLITQEEKRQMTAGNCGKINAEFAEWLMGYEQQFTKLIPTPTATDYKGGKTSRYYSGGVQTSSERISGMHAPWENWPDEPGVDRVVDGLPHRMDRVKCLGNAVVPQQFYPFFMAIMDEIRKEGKDNGMDQSV